MSCRNWLCTYNLESGEVDGWKDILEAFFKGSKATYAVGQLEKGYCKPKFDFVKFVPTSRRTFIILGCRRDSN